MNKKRRPGDPNPVPGSQELDHMANILRYENPGPGGPGQGLGIVNGLFWLIDRRKERKAKARAIAAWKATRDQDNP